MDGTSRLGLHFRFGTISIREKARNNRNNKRATELILLYKDKGLSLQQIADKLNANGFRTAAGKVFHRTSVKRLWDRTNQ